MSFKKSLLFTQVIFLLTQSLVWAQTTTKASVKPAPVSFDAPRKPFKDTEAGKEYLRRHGSNPKITDLYGYPMHDRPVVTKKLKAERKKIDKSKTKIILRPGPKVLPKKKNPNVKTSFLKTILDLIIPSAAAYDPDPEVPGLINCRPSNLPSNAGYFKAYFEDIADNTNSGYDEDDNNLGPARVTAVCDVLHEIASIIMMNLPGGPTPSILFTKTWPSDSPLNALATASSYYGVVQSFSGTDSGTLHGHIISRIDPNPIGPDAYVNTNWNVAWSVDSNLNAGTYDFKTVMRHEVLHAMGFGSLLPSSINSTSTIINHSIFDKSLFSLNTSFLTSSFSPLLQVPVGSPSAWFTNNASIYNGKRNYVGAQQDGIRPLYTPSDWIQGSSLSHFDMNRPEANSQVYVMHPSIPTNEQRNIHIHEKEVLCHLGYQVAGLDGCEWPTPIAYGDQGILSGLTTDIPLLMNDLSVSGGVITLNEVEFVTPNNPSIIYYENILNGSCDINSQSANSLQNANFPVRCIKVTTPTTMAQFKMRYTIRDYDPNSPSINRISQPALVLYSRCNVASNEHICNGNFEMGGASASNCANSISNGLVPFWFGGSSDLVINTGFLSYGNWCTFPKNYYDSNPPSIMENFPDNSTYGMFIQSYNYNGFWDLNLTGSEYVSTKLKTPLIPGQCYELSLKMTHVTQRGSTLNLVAKLSREDLAINDSNELFNGDIDGIKIIDQQVLPLQPSADGRATWVNISKYFSPSQAHEYFILYSKTNSMPSLNGTFVNNSIYADNLSIKKVTSSLCPPHSISGVVYNDLSGDGNMTLGEPVLDGVHLGLFNSQTGELIDEAVTLQNGEYKFFSVLPSDEYTVALISEPSFQSISEPLVSSPANGILANGDQSTFQYYRNVSFTNGGVVTGENFGLLLTGQHTSTPPNISQEVGCNNSKLIATPTGGSAPYGYLWTGPNGFTSTSSTPTVTIPGTYTVLVNGTNYVASAQITLSQVQGAQITAVVNSTSNGVTINSTVTGATPTSYSWTGPSGYTSNQQNATGITAFGTYTVVASFGNNCTTQTSVNFQRSCAGAPPTTSFNTSLTSANNVPLFQCYLHTTPTGGKECLYNFANPAGSNPNGWNTGCPSSVAGTYCCGWTRACAGTTISGALTHATNGNNGSIILTVEGNNPFTYQWSNGATTQNLSNLAPGTYTVTAYNSAGCMTTASFLIHRTMSVNLAKSQACTLASNTLTATVSGGASPYTYRWYKMNGTTPVLQSQYTLLNSPNLTQTITSVPAGIYNVVITDTNGQQQASQNVTIDAYTAPTIAFTKTNATGTAYNNGKIIVTVTGGVGPFNYNFTGANPLTVNAQPSPYSRLGLSGSDAQTYSVSVTDSKPCSSNTLTGIKVLNTLTATTKAVVDCSSGVNKIRLMAVPAGGHNGFTYEWKQGTSVVATTESFLATPSAVYTLQVKDNSTPQQVSPVYTVTAPSTVPLLHSVTVAVTSATNGQSNGSATVTATAGLGPYTFTYTPPGTVLSGILSNINTRGNLAPGAYSVGVKTNYGCNVNKSFTILNTTTATSDSLLKQ